MAPKQIIQKRRKQLAMVIRRSSSTSPSTTPNSTPSSSLASTPRSILSREELSEMRRLGKMLPIHMQLKNRHEDPLMLINDAATYINHLTATVVSRVQKGSLPREVLERILPQVLSPSTENTSPDSTQKVSRKRLRRRV